MSVCPWSSTILPSSAKRLIVVPRSVTGSSMVGAGEYPSGRDSVAFGDLLLRLHPEPLEDGAVEGHRFFASLVAAEGCVVDVVHEVGAVEVLHP